MPIFTIYHNPLCSKSRKALQILQDKRLEPLIIEYIKSPLDIEQLRTLRTHFDLRDFVRINEPVFKSLGLSLDNEAQLLQTMVKEPLLMQRPIITYKDKAIIGRTPEKILEFMSDIEKDKKINPM